MRGLFHARNEMKRSLAAAAVLAGLTAAGVAHSNEKLAQSSGCMTCHAIDKKVIGPSYKQVADKYRNDKGAEAALIKKVKAGGKGAWGETPMPPNAHVKDQDIKTLVQWILSLK
jgi:cytochrome c